MKRSSQRGGVPVRMSFDRSAETPEIPEDLPTTNVPEVTHIGTLNPDDKQSHSYEGPLLSVSTNPDSWRIIAKLGGLPEHRIAGGDFIDRHALSSPQWKNVIAWAKSEGHVTPSWEYSVDTEDELGDPAVVQLPSLREAREEAAEIGASRVHAKRTVRPTSDDARGMPGNDYALTQAAKQKNMRGVWWSDEDDSAWSAPRGGVFYPIAP